MWLSVRATTIVKSHTWGCCVKKTKLSLIFMLIHSVNVNSGHALVCLGFSFGKQLQTWNPLHRWIWPPTWWAASIIQRLWVCRFVMQRDYCHPGRNRQFVINHAQKTMWCTECWAKDNSAKKLWLTHSVPHKLIHSHFLIYKGKVLKSCWICFYHKHIETSKCGNHVLLNILFLRMYYMLEVAAKERCLLSDLLYSLQEKFSYTNNLRV